LLPSHVTFPAANKIQIDTLQTLAACANNYGPQTISNYANSIWDTIRFEILSANDEDVSSQALLLLRAITTTLSFGLSPTAPSSSPLFTFLRTVVETCSKELRDIEAKMARPAGKVLSTCSSVSAPANKFIVGKVIPQLILLFRETDSTNKRTAILDVLNGFLDATREVFGETRDVEEVPIMLCKDDLFEVYSKGFLGSGSEETTYKITALEGFRKLLSLKGILSNNEIGIVVQYFDDVVLRDENEETWYIQSLQTLIGSGKVLAALAELAKTKPQLILDISFPAFLAELPDSEIVEKREGSLRPRKGFKTILAGLAQISSERVIFEVLLRRLFSKLEIVLSSICIIHDATNRRHHDVYDLSPRHSRDYIPCHTEEVVDQGCGYTLLHRHSRPHVAQQACCRCHDSWTENKNLV